jgi:hypothetical protein
MRDWKIIILLAACALVQGCGGGGGDSSTAVPVDDGTLTATVPPAPNVHPVSVNAGLGSNVNLAFTSVTLCAPGSASNCQTIDHVLVDTGSSGLRLMSSALAATLALPQQTYAGGDPVVECAQFVDGYTWGPVKLTDLKLAGEQANSLPIQVVGDPEFAAVPSRCSATGPSKNSVQSLGANGILGLSVFRQDCGSDCTQPNDRGMYYSCVAAVCQQTPILLEKQVQNPVSKFARNNNGMIMVLPAVPAAGAARLAGALVFGIGTQANNALGSASVIGVDPANANFTTLYNGSSYFASFIDSGSNGLFFDDSLPLCPSGSAAPGFYCPAATAHRSATIQGAKGASANVAFSIANAAELLAANPGYAAFGNLGAPFSAHSFDWGLPFFYGRSVYTAIEGAGTPGGPAGPYVAF